MKQVVIENPIINSPFDEPGRHFRFSDEGIVASTPGEKALKPILRPAKTEILAAWKLKTA